MKQAFFALKGGDWEEKQIIFRVQAKATESAFDRIQEAFEKVAKDEARKLSTVQKIMLRSVKKPNGNQQTKALWKKKAANLFV